jgi:hypothetical protein
MASKKGRQLAERAAATTRQPKPARLVAEQARTPGYRVVPVSLYVPEAEWLDTLSQALKGAGNPKANRSLLVREAIHRLQEELAGKTPDAVLRYFIEQHTRRAARRP